ncbi:ubiquinone biosynthesis O-methyltransferase-like [Glossina fuscipes]|uniref:Ubiquinone biosynthesis O-methyltransferase, mitochondrial n=1 Tax=Glossina fuscipes TaxID=7396 RepID=A0A8U0WAD4_9MUSC|nr:ubiquinone biosynthesis O-methyltransferase-like [Glossina fuscipes]
MSTYTLKSLRNIVQRQRVNGIRCFAGIDGIRENVTKNCTLPVEPQQQISDHTKRDVQHHSNKAEGWWDLDGPMKGLHRMNLLRVPFIRDGLVARGSVDSKLINTNNVLQNQQILEVGCGGGILTEQLARLDAKITGIDLSDVLINVACEHLKQEANARLLNNITYKTESIEAHMQDKKNFYDAVIISEVLEHIDNKEPFLKACIQCLKPGGSVFITTLNQTVRMWIVGVLIAEYLLGFIPIGTHHWKYMISPLNVQKMLDTMGCQTILVNGWTYQYRRQVWRKINSTSMVYAMQAIKTQALQ